jgi:hypothetical protein
MDRLGSSNVTIPSCFGHALPIPHYFGDLLAMWADFSSNSSKGRRFAALSGARLCVPTHFGALFLRVFRPDGGPT